MDDNCVKTEETGTSGRKRFKLPNKYLTIGLVAFIVVAACILFYYLFLKISHCLDFQSINPKRKGIYNRCGSGVSA